MIEGIIPLLKLTLGLATTGLTLNILKDMKVLNLLEGKIRKMTIKKIVSFPLGDRHTSVLGASGCGKTYATLQSLKKTKKGVIFFNFQQEKVPSGIFTKCDGKDSVIAIKQIVDSGGKVNFIPHRDRTEASKQVKAFVDLFLGDGKEHNIYIVVDEVHLYDSKGVNALMQVATAGRRWGVFGVFITQRPANMDNNLLGQSGHIVCFNLKENDRKYLKTNGFPMEDMMGKINNQERVFVVYDGLTVDGAYKVQ